MAKAFVLVEHRQGMIRDATFECVTLARDLEATAGLEPVAVVLGSAAAPFAASLAKLLPETILIEHAGLEVFRYETYAAVLRDVVERERPLVVIAPHSAFGMELVPRLSAELDRPCATDCTAVTIEDGAITVLRSVHNGKINERLSFAPAGGYFVTVRAGSYAPASEAERPGAIREHPCPALPSEPRTEHRGYRESAAGAVDISQAPFIIAIGRGIKDAENIPKVQALADRLGAVLACSRPVVDKKWLGKDRQVGTSGRTVKPKAYLALGISGAFQHIAGIKGAGLFIAVNRDPKAPIFRAADFGVAEDLFKIVDALAEKLGAN